MGVGVWVAGARVRTLPAALVPVMVGSAVAWEAGAVAPVLVVLCAVVALCLQVGVNFANDFSDGVAGVDDVRVGPTRLVASGAASARAVLWAAVGALGVGAAAGVVVVVISQQWWLLAVGVCALAAAWLYTGGPAPYGYRALGEMSVFVFFGLVAVLGTVFVQLGAVTFGAVLLAVSVGLVACALLVVNNLRDRANDEKVGKRTLAVLLGDRGTRYVFAGLMVGAFVSLLAASGVYGFSMLLVLLAAPVAYVPVRKILAGAEGKTLIPILGETARTHLLLGAAATAGVLV